MSLQTEILSKNVADGAVEWLNSQCWHDSVLYEIRLIRAHSADQVVLRLGLIDHGETEVIRSAEITFKSCFLVEIQMHGGVECISDAEMIAVAQARATGTLIEQVKATWAKLNLYQSNLAEFHLELASTGSTIRLVFGSVQMNW